MLKMSGDLTILCTVDVVMSLLVDWWEARGKCRLREEDPTAGAARPE